MPSLLVLPLVLVPLVASEGAPEVSSAPVSPAPGLVAPGPVPTEAAPSSSPSPEKADALGRYAKERLVRVPTGRKATPGRAWSNTRPTSLWLPDAAAWTVTDGAGHWFTAPAFASWVGDEDMVERTTGGMAVALAVGAPFLVWGIATIAEAPRNEREIALFPIMAGIGGITLGLYPPLLTVKRRGRVSNYYPASRADDLVRSYNARLRESLGLTEEDVREVEAARPSP